MTSQFSQGFICPGFTDNSTLAIAPHLKTVLNQDEVLLSPVKID